MSVPSDAPLSVTEMALLGQLWEEYRPRLLAMLRGRIDPRLAVRVDPEEVLADAFVDAAREWPRFRGRGDSSAYAWLYGLARERLIEVWRRQSRGRRDLRRDLPWPEESSAALGMSLVGSVTSPSQAVARGELKERMTQALGLLKDHDREVLWMRNDGQLSFAEIGQVLGVTENTAAVRYGRALKRLGTIWRTHYGEGEP